MKITDLLILIFFIFISCARQSSPSGGPKDEKAAELVSSDPYDGELNYNEKRLTFTFDEYVKITNPNQEILVAPRLKENFEVLLKKRSVILKLYENLKENTTYKIDFGESVKDNTEGNISKDIYVVFSTGNQLDSLEISGKVINSKTGTAPENVYVFLYESKEDSLIFNEKPDYITRANNSGNFSLSNLPDKKYQIAAIQENNNNYLFDDNEELISFKNDMVSSSDTKSKSLIISLFSPQTIPKRIKPAMGQNSINLQTLVSKLLKVTINSPNTNFVSEPDFTSDSVLYYYNNLNDSLINLYIGSEVTGETDTFEIANYYFNRSKSRNRIKLFKHPENNSNIVQNFENPLQIKTPDPIKKINSELIKIYRISDSLLMESNSVKKENYESLIEIDAKLLPKQNYKMLIDSGAIINWFDEMNHPDSLLFSTADTSDFTRIKVSFSNIDSSRSYVVNLYNEYDMIIHSEKLTSDSLLIENIYKGKYSLKVFEDNNNNGIRDNGDYGKKLQPEQIYFLNDAAMFNLKGGLEMEFLVDF